MIDKLAIAYCQIAGVSYEDGLKLASFERKHKADFEIEWKEHPMKPAKQAVGKNGPAFTCSCTDHLGKVYASKTAMCNAYGIKLYTLINRMNRGMDLETALTTKVTKQEQRYRGPFKDHLGNEFETLTKLCNHWGISVSMYQGRIRHGMSVERALTAENRRFIRCADHLGKHFDSKKEMCEYHHVKLETFLERIKKGWTLEQALTMRKHKRYKELTNESKSS